MNGGGTPGGRGLHQGDSGIGQPDGLHVAHAIVNQECVNRQVQEIPLTDPDVRDPHPGGLVKLNALV